MKNKIKPEDIYKIFENKLRREKKHLSEVTISSYLKDLNELLSELYKGGKYNREAFKSSHPSYKTVKNRLITYRIFDSVGNLLINSDNKKELLFEHNEENEIIDTLKQRKRVKDSLLEVMKDVPNDYSGSFLVNQHIVHTLLLAEYDIELDYTYLKEIMKDVFNRKIVPKSFYQKRDELIQQGFVEDLSDRKSTLHRVRRDKLDEFRNYALNDENFISNRKMLIPKYRYLVIKTKINELLENPTEKDIQALLKLISENQKDLFYPAELISQIIKKIR